MKRNALYILGILIACNSFAQENAFTARGYLSPVFGQSIIQNRVLIDGQLISTNLKKSGGLFFGVGFELLNNLTEDWLVGANVGFISKGYFATMDTAYSYGSVTGTTYIRTNLSFFEPAIFIERQILLNNPEYKLLLAAGLFYSFHVRNFISFGLEANGNDFGTSISAGIQKNRFFVKLDFEKGLINIENNAKATFKTNVLSVKIGYSFLK